MAIADAKPFSDPTTPGDGTVRTLLVGREIRRESFWLCALSRVTGKITAKNTILRKHLLPVKKDISELPGKNKTGQGCGPVFNTRLWCCSKALMSVCTGLMNRGFWGGVVTHIRSAHPKNNVFGDIRRMIGDAF
jgi:hypothetical protein